MADGNDYTVKNSYILKPRRRIVTNHKLVKLFFVVLKVQRRTILQLIFSCYKDSILTISKKNIKKLNLNNPVQTLITN